MRSRRLLAVCLAWSATAACTPVSLAQADDRACAPHIEALTAAVDGEGPRRVLFADHLQMLIESQRRGEERLCLDLADDLRERLNDGEA